MTNLAKILTLTRPLVVFDVESTGSNPDLDRIIQIAITKHYPSVLVDHESDGHSHSYLEKMPIAWSTFINPGIPVPPEVSEIHGITDAMLASQPTFHSLASHLVRTAMTGVDFCGQNVLFDLRIFRAECRRAMVDWDWETTDAKVIDTLKIRQITRPNDLASMYEELTGEKMNGAHDAGNDVAATETVLRLLLEKYPTVPRDVAALSSFCWPVKPGSVDAAGKFVWRNGVACFAFGKWNGVPMAEPKARGYLQWMFDKGDFPAETKTVIQKALDGIWPIKP